MAAPEGEGPSRLIHAPTLWALKRWAEDLIAANDEAARCELTGMGFMVSVLCLSRIGRPDARLPIWNARLE